MSMRGGRSQIFHNVRAISLTMGFYSLKINKVTKLLVIFKVPDLRVILLVIPLHYMAGVRAESRHLRNMKVIKV